MARSSQGGTVDPAKLTFQDLVEMPEDRNRYEILDGELVVTPPPLTRHQIVSANLMLALHAHVRANRLGTVLAAPTGVVLDAHTVVLPDLLFVRADRSGIIERHAIVGAPDLVVEILSRSTAARDRGTKGKLYARFGVDHYWIVDPRDNILEAFQRTGDVYGPCDRYTGSSVVHLGPFQDLALDLGSVWG